jgi:sialate O-acetylesterase
MRNKFIILMLLSCLAARAEVKVAAVFGDSMVVQRDKPVPVWGTATPGEKITVEFAGQTKSGVTDAAGRWEVALDPLPASAEPRIFVVSASSNKKSKIITHQFANVLVGDVWLCSGQSNMNMSMRPFPPWHQGVLNHAQEIAAAQHPHLRLFSVAHTPRHAKAGDVAGEWLVCSPVTVADFSGVAYFFGRKLLVETGVPQGVILSAVGGTSIQSWRDPTRIQEPSTRQKIAASARQCAASADQIAAFEKALPAYLEKSLAAARTNGARIAGLPEPFKGYRSQPGYCYNGMLAPLAPCALRGLVWYQGEADTSWAAGYTAALRDFIAQGRAEFRDAALPCYLVQLANYDPALKRPGAPARGPVWAALRQSQLEVLRAEPRSGLAVATDVGLADKIHPPDKRTVGERLARWALVQVYARPIECSGPLFQSLVIAGGKAVVHFSHAEGLVLKAEGNLSGFELAGADGAFQSALATVRGDAVELTHPAVAQPTAARYGWADNPRLTLFNAAGLPAAPFTSAPP